MEIESEQGTPLTAVDGDFNFKVKVFNLENVQECQRLVDNPPDCLKYLGEILGLPNYVTKARQAFVVDYFHGINQFVSETKLKECYTIKRRDVVDVETIFIPPLAEALSKEEVEAQELLVKEALEAKEKARQEAAAMAEAERLATEEARRLEESKKKPRNLEEAIDFIVRKKLEEFKKSFLAECGAEQNKLLDKLQLVEGGSENKPKKR